MIVWQGLGFLVVVIALAVLMAVQYLVNAYIGADMYELSDWPKLLSGAIAGVIVFLIGLKLNNKEGRVVIDKESQQEMELKKTHTLFWIPMHYWGAIIPLIAVAVVLFG